MKIENTDKNSSKIEFCILTLFPEMFEGVFEESLLKKAQNKGLIKIKVVNLRGFAKDKHKTVDDKPYGGGPGMILKVDVLDKAIAKERTSNKTKVILLSPQGQLFNQYLARKLSKFKKIILICGHYEGVDERVKTLIDEEISIGDYILTGGEFPAMVIVDTVSRLVPNVVGKESSILEESLENGLLKYPQYTKPLDFNRMKVPKILLSGNHEEIKKWRNRQSIKKTTKLRPDLLKNN